MSGISLSVLFSFLSLFTGLSQSLSAAGWRSQSIYQVLTDRFARTDGSTTQSCSLGSYCGGTWEGLINHLDYIQDMGFTAVWISPVVENLQSPTSSDGDSYHGYWAQNIYEVNTNFGSATDLVALSTALHDRGMYLMVDVVTNHMGYDGCGDCVDYSVFTPFNQESDYHPFCLIDYDNTTSIEMCWAGDNTISLPDLKTESDTVLAVWQDWIEELVANYTIDGLRIDSGMEVDEAFFPPFLDSAGIFALVEVYNGNEYTFCPMQEYMNGMLNFPAYFWITQAFESTSGSISNLAYGLNMMISECIDTTLLGNFLENHDVARFPSLTSDMALTKNAIGFTMLSDGIPIVYQGQEQHFSGSSVPNNREAVWLSGYSTSATLYTYITKLNAIRNQAISQDTSYVTSIAKPVYTDSSTIVMLKGSTGSQVLSVFSNEGASGSNSFTLSASESKFTAGQSVTDLISCKTYAVDSSGNLAVNITNGLPLVFYPTSQMLSSGPCNASDSSSSSTTSSTKSSTTISASSSRSGTTLSTSTTRSGTVSSTSTTKSSTTLYTSTSKSGTASTTSVTKTSSSVTQSSTCVVPTAMAVVFEDEVTTEWGQTIKVVGSISQLGGWNTSKAIAMSADDYTECDPYWFQEVSLPAGTVIEYKYINVGSDGSVTWEADPNHTYTIPSTGCEPTVTVSDTWQTWA